MKALVCNEYGGLEKLNIEELPEPKLSVGQVLIKVAVCGVNFPDLLMIDNKYQVKPGLPFVPGGEVAGEIINIGEGVENFKIGQRVVALCGWGGFSEKLAVYINRVFVLPDYISFKAAASISYNYSTAFYALNQRGNIKPGEKVLILGAAGGVGLAAVTIAKILGASVIAAASSQEKLEVCKKHGADFLINYSTENIREKLKEIVGDDGVDVVFDVVGGELSEAAFRSLAWKGRFLVVGFAGGKIAQLPLNLALMKGADLIGVIWGNFSRKESEVCRENFKQIMDWYGEDKIIPEIFKEFGLDQACNALEILKDRKVIGKALVICDEKLAAETHIQKAKKVKKLIFENKEMLLSFQGSELGESDTIFISQDLINQFAVNTRDKQWIHIDKQRAMASPFQSTIAHGWLLMALSPELLSQIYELKFAKTGINYGTDKIRFIQPVNVESQLYMRAKLLEAVSIKSGGIKMKIEVAYFVVGNEKPVCIAELLSVVY